jgi:DNA-binding LacI/PurR family transcriptional regulator
MHGIQIALILPIRNPAYRPNAVIYEHIPSIVSGICDIVVQQEGWTVHLWDADHLSAGEFRRRWRLERPDAAIVFPVNDLRSGPLWELGVPTVSLLVRDGTLPAVCMDHYAIGALAARHLRAPGWTAVLLGATAEPWWRQRCQGFHSVWPDAEVVPWPTRANALRRWSASLPPRTAIFADQDFTAVRLLPALLAADRTFGSDLRLLGVDDEIPCRMSRPAISSIRLPWRVLGRQAALLLDQQMRGTDCPALVQVPPVGVAARSTCGSIPDSDPMLGAVARSLYRAVESGSRIPMADMVGQRNASLRTIERAWKSATGSTLMESLQRIRCDLALRLIGSGMDDLDAIARACGCGGRQNLRRVLGNHAGLGSVDLAMLQQNDSGHTLSPPGGGKGQASAGVNWP